MNRALPLQGDIKFSGPTPRLAVARKGFRPFFFLAALFAVAIVPIWLLTLFGQLAPTSYVDATTWHGHEMVFGFATAVIAGFLLTAVGNWTQRETIVGGGLLALGGLWVAGRVAMSLPNLLPRGLPAVVDLAFLPALFVVLARPLVATGNRRNFVMLAIVAALFGANLAVHLDALGFVPLGTGRHALVVAVDVIVLLCLVIAGRIVPMFTRKATSKPVTNAPTLIEVPTILAMVAVIALDVAAPSGRLAGIAAAIAGCLALVRAARWGTQHTAKHPLLWILHAGYAWIVVGLLLRVLPVPPSAATHAFTVGTIGALTLGMMARVALGHTGRLLASTRAMTAAFALVSLAAVARVFGPIVAPASYGASLIAAGTAWTAAFVLYLWVYTPILFAPRTDGRPG